VNTRQRISDFQHHVNSHAAEIRKAADDAWNTINLTQSEPQIIYDFLKNTKGGTGHLNRELGKLLSVGGRIVKFASIFLHQKPKVKGVIGRTTNVTEIGGECELGDLQTLFLYVAADKSLRQCRSTIFQAKKEPSTGQYVIPHVDQRRLYDKCSGFVYRSVLKGERRCFPWGLAEKERALQYLFVGKLPIQARLIPADANKGAYVDFGEIILRFLNNSSGFGVTTEPSTGKNWSRIVWDQIENVANTAFGQQGDRNAALKSILDQFNSFDDPNEFFLEVAPSEASEDSAGIPILLIVVSDSELGPETIKQLQAHIEVTGEKRLQKKLPSDPTTVTVKRRTTTGQSAEKNNPNSKQDLQSANINDLLVILKAGSKEERHDIVIELLRRSGYRAIMAYEAKYILDILNHIHQDLNPETMSAVYELQQDLRSVTGENEVHIFQ
jgi:hypothetical protein